MSAKVKMLIIGLILIVIGVFIDQITKQIIISTIKITGYDFYNRPIAEPVVVIKGFFSITYVENTGGGWSIMAGKLWFFYIVTIIALFAFGYFMKDFNLKTYPLYSISLVLMISGTLGNFIDRVLKKYVVDFLDFIIFGYDFPTFNFADICLTLGVIGLLLSIFLRKSPN